MYLLVLRCFSSLAVAISQHRVLFNGSLNRSPNLAVDPVKSKVICLPFSAAVTDEFRGFLLSLSGIYDVQGRCNSFSMKEGDILQMRSNARHDTLLILHETNVKELEDFARNGNRGREKLEARHKFSVKGIRGPCVFRPLIYFDVGSSFLTDSLHNIYLGLFVSKIHLFQTW